MGQSERLTEQFKDSTDLNKLLDGLTDPYDELQQAAIDIREKTRLDTAEGEQAKLNARKVGVTLTGFPDVVFRAITAVQILANRAFGGANSQMEIASLLGEFLSTESQSGTIDVNYVETLPSRHTIILIAVTIENRFRNFFRKLACGAKTGGTQCFIMHGETTAGTTEFKFDTAGQGLDEGALTEVF